MQIRRSQNSVLKGERGRKREMERKRGGKRWGPEGYSGGIKGGENIWASRAQPFEILNTEEIILGGWTKASDLKDVGHCSFQLDKASFCRPALCSLPVGDSYRQEGCSGSVHKDLEGGSVQREPEYSSPS